MFGGFPGITWFQGGTEGGSVVANRTLRGDCKGGNIKILQSLLGKSGILLHTTHPPSYTQPTPPPPPLPQAINNDRFLTKSWYTDLAYFFSDKF